MECSSWLLSENFPDIGNTVLPVRSSQWSCHERRRSHRVLGKSKNNAAFFLELSGSSTSCGSKFLATVFQAIRDVTVTGPIKIYIYIYFFYHVSVYNAWLYFQKKFKVFKITLKLFEDYIKVTNRNITWLVYCRYGFVNCSPHWWWRILMMT